MRIESNASFQNKKCYLAKKEKITNTKVAYLLDLERCAFVKKNGERCKKHNQL